jgi:uncharacterized membrane protein YhaH (DUF805 family)
VVGSSSNEVDVLSNDAARSRCSACVDFLFNHDGRIGRLYYWLGLAATMTVTGFFAGIADVVVPAVEIMRYTAVAFIVGLLIWMHSAVTMKRLHDRDRAGIGYFLYGLGPPGLLLWAIYLHADNRGDAASPLYVASLIGLVGVSVELGFMRGTIGANRFGPDPASTTGERNMEFNSKGG